jgi:hypothetical protein
VKSIGSTWGRRSAFAASSVPSRSISRSRDKAAAHVSVEHEGETTEHLALAESGLAGEDVAHSIRKYLVVGHGYVRSAAVASRVGRPSLAAVA